jgi:hypothetical protein
LNGARLKSMLLNFFFFANDQSKLEGAATLSITTLSIMADGCYAEWHLCQVSLMLIVSNPAFLLSVLMLNVVILNVVAP